MRHIPTRLCWRTVAVTIPITLLFYVETLIIKGLMLANAGSLFSIFDVFRAMREEMLWLALISGFILVFSASLRKLSLTWISVPFSLLIIISLLALIIHYGLFLTTGTGINAEYLRNWVQNPSEVNRMIASELRPEHILLLVVQVGGVLFLALIPRLKRVRRLRKLFPVERRKKLVGWLAIFLIFLEAGALLPPLDRVNASITQVPVFELIKGFFPETEEREVPIDILPEERMDGPLKFDLSSEARRLNIVLIIFESLNWKYCDVYKPGLGATPF